MSAWRTHDSHRDRATPIDLTETLPPIDVEAGWWSRTVFLGIACVVVTVVLLGLLIWASSAYLAAGVLVP